MKKIFIFLICLTPQWLAAQSKTTDDLQKRFDDSFTAFFYKNTLRMINQTDSKEFDEIVKNIEKLKFLVVDKSKHDFGASDYKKLKKGYTSETYEEIMSSRYEGRNIDVYLKDKKGSKLGTVLLVNDSTNLYILDMIGTIDITQASRLFSTLDGSSEIAQRIKSFTDNKGGDKHKKSGEKSIHND